MTRRSTNTRLQIAEEAADWFSRLHERDDVPEPVRRDFVDWLMESPVHVQEYLATSKLWSDLESMDPDLHAALDVSAAQDDLGPDVVPFDGASGQAASDRVSPFVKPKYWIAGTAASVIVAIGALGVFLGSDRMTEPVAETFRTGLGEQRSIVMDDGSIIELNTLTEITVTYKPDERRVTLIDGEALFDVEENPLRPFVVDTGSASVRVLGTRFNVYKSDGATEVTVLEGKVAIERPPPGNELPDDTRDLAGSKGMVELLVGEQARFAPQTPQIVTATLASTEQVTAWTQRRLVFEATPLSEIVTQFNRYNANQLELEDGALADLELSGVFGSNDPESLIEFLRHVRDVEVDRYADGTLIIREQPVSLPR